MEVDTSRLKKGTSEVPQECQNLIDKLKACERNELIEDHMTSGYQSSNSSSGISGMHSGLFLPSETTSFILEEATHYAEHPIYIMCVSPQFENERKHMHLVRNFATLHTSSTDTIDTCHSKAEQTTNEKCLENDLMLKYSCKEEIVQDLLMYLPLLRPTNEEGKKVYLQFLPVLVEDTIKQNLPVELVQQIFSYLLIHPAVKSEDRKILELRSCRTHHRSQVHHPQALLHRQHGLQPYHKFKPTQIFSVARKKLAINWRWTFATLLIKH